ncbi:hypothetical protein IDM32_19280 [Acinetobacter seifertii]|nr:hypothetical protein [Acinetobacter seifertii]
MMFFIAVNKGQLDALSTSATTRPMPWVTAQPTIWVVVQAMTAPTGAVSSPT